MSTTARKSQTGEPGNPGQFGTKRHSDPVGISLTSGSTAVPEATRRLWAKSAILRAHSEGRGPAAENACGGQAHGAEEVALLATPLNQPLPEGATTSIAYRLYATREAASTGELPAHRASEIADHFERRVSETLRDHPDANPSDPTSRSGGYLWQAAGAAVRYRDPSLADGSPVNAVRFVTEAEALIDRMRKETR
jgi:hypothetical protein